MGDLVYLLDSATNIGQSKKLQSPWKGPYLIVKVLSNILFRICGQRGDSVIHHDRLKLYEGTEIPLWVRRARHNMEVANVIEDTPGEVTAGNSRPVVEQEQVVDEGDVHERGKQTSEQTVTMGDVQGEAVGKQEIAASEIRTGRHRSLPKHLQDFIVDL